MPGEVPPFTYTDTELGVQVTTICVQVLRVGVNPGEKRDEDPPQSAKKPALAFR